MKKIILLLGAVPLLSYAQENVRQIHVELESKEVVEPEVGFRILIKKNNELVPGYLNNLPGAVLKNFTSKYPGVSEVDWLLEDKTIMANFTAGGKDISIKYKKDGYHLSTRKTYAPNALPLDVSLFVEREMGKTFTTNYITEVNREEYVFYEISLSNDKKWCMLNLSRRYDEALKVDDKKYFTRN